MKRIIDIPDIETLKGFDKLIKAVEELIDNCPAKGSKKTDDNVQKGEHARE